MTSPRPPRPTFARYSLSGSSDVRRVGSAPLAALRLGARARCHPPTRAAHSCVGLAYVWLHLHRPSCAATPALRGGASSLLIATRRHAWPAPKIVMPATFCRRSGPKKHCGFPHVTATATQIRLIGVTVFLDKHDRAARSCAAFPPNYLGVITRIFVEFFLSRVVNLCIMFFYIFPIILLWPCLVQLKNQKLYKIFHHIEFCGICIKH